MLVKNIPESLIYEISDGKPIYYKGYQDVLNKTKTLEDIMGCSSLQALIISCILEYLYKNIPSHYKIFTNEVGLQIQKGMRRACDIVLFDKEQLKDYTYNDKLFSIPPKIVIEVDIKADMEEFVSPLDYYFKKTEELLQFGVEKLIWITTDSQKITLAAPAQDWIIKNWNADIEILPGLTTNVQGLVA
ncbi:MAG: Uma2 family endonuclease [Microscillaceae bacterium]|nr:Uma2 family endonuclease [Microscillaceae bacterium]